MMSLIKYLKCLFLNYNLNWDKSCFDKRKDAVYLYYQTDYFDENKLLPSLISFRRTGGSMYDTQAKYIGAVFFTAPLETTNDLKKICGKSYRTMHYAEDVKIPSFYKMIKCFPNIYR